MALSLPETLVVSVTLHGTIALNEDKSVPTFQVPVGMRVSKVNAVPPDVCNMMTDPDASAIQQRLTEIAPPGTTKTYEQIVSDLTTLLPRFKAMHKETIKNVRSDPVVSVNPDTAQFVRYADLGFANVYSNATLVDKQYSRSADEGISTGPAGEDNQTFNYKINAINVPGVPDLFGYYINGAIPAVTRGQRANEDDKAIQLSDLIAYLHGKLKVTNLIIVDFSCSSIIGTMTARERRYVRRTTTGARRRKTNSVSRRKRRRNGVRKARTRRVH